MLQQPFLATYVNSPETHGSKAKTNTKGQSVTVLLNADLQPQTQEMIILHMLRKAANF